MDAEGRCHSFVDKIPIFTSMNLDADSEYPIRGSVRCEVIGRFKDEKGRDLVRVTTARPDSIESSEGRSEFTVSANLINSVPG